MIARVSRLVTEEFARSVVRGERQALPEFLRRDKMPVQEASDDSDVPWHEVDGPPRALKRVVTLPSVGSLLFFLESLVERNKESAHPARITVDGQRITVEAWTRGIETITESDRELADDVDDILIDALALEQDRRF